MFERETRERLSNASHKLRLLDHDAHSINKTPLLIMLHIRLN